MTVSSSLIVVPVEQAGRIRPLFEADDLATWNACIGAVLEGTCPGRAWTDSLDNPRAAFLITPEGSFLAGDAAVPAFGEALRALITGTIFHPEGYHFHALLVTCAAGWLPLWESIAPFPLVTLARQHYLCSRVTFDWRAALPDGFSVHLIDDSLLESPEINWPDHVHEWISNNWCKRANFLAHGFGVVMLHAALAGPQVVSWSLADGVSTAGEGGVYGEIGIHTRPDYRQRGLATITAAAAVEHALSLGWQSVGWHCHAENTASARTALAVGFRHTRDYTSSLCVVPSGTTASPEHRPDNAHPDAREDSRSG